MSEILKLKPILLLAEFSSSSICALFLLGQGEVGPLGALSLQMISKK